MAEETDLEDLKRGTELVKRGFARMQKGGVIMDVVNREQARIAEDAGAVAVMALEAVPADIRKRGGVARMPDPVNVEEIIDEVSIPVMGKSRIGHTMEARILESLGVDMIDESEVLTPADDDYHIDKRDFDSPFVCGARNLPEALRRIEEGAAMIRTKGEAGTGDVNQAVTHQRNIKSAIREIQGKTYEEREKWAREHEAPAHLVHETAEQGRLPVVGDGDVARLEGEVADRAGGGFEGDVRRAAEGDDDPRLHRAGLRGERLHISSDLDDGLAVRVAHDRNDEPLLGIHGDAQVHVLEHLNRFVAEVAVEHGELAQRSAHRLAEEPEERELDSHLRGLGLEVLAQLHERGDIRVRELGDGRDLVARNHVLPDRLAAPRILDAARRGGVRVRVHRLLMPLCRLGRCCGLFVLRLRSGLLWWLLGGLLLLGRSCTARSGLDVGLEHAAVRAAALHRRDIDSLLAREPARGRSGEHALGLVLDRALRG